MDERWQLSFLNIRFEQRHHLRVVLCHLLIIPSLAARDLRHPLEFGTLNFNRVLEILGLGFWQAVAELRVRADADQREVAEKIALVTRDGRT